MVVSALLTLAPRPHDAQSAAAAPRLLVDAPRPLIAGDPVQLRAVGLEPGAGYELRADLVDEFDRRWSSRAQLHAATDGTLDLTRDPALRGSWLGVDPLGPFWSATLTEPRTLPPDATPADSAVIHVVLRRGSATLDSVRLVRWHVRQGVRTEPLRGAGLVGTLFRPVEPGPRPLVVLVGGSGGGSSWARQVGGALASRGYATLALAYFAAEGLPRSLEAIPLEYFETATRQAIGQGAGLIDERRIAVMGLSRGAEAALVLGSRLALVSAVVAFAPSHVVWQGSRPPEYPVVPSWTERGVPIPFVPNVEPRPYRASDNEATRHLRYLLHNAGASVEAEIPVERIRGPIMLVAGGADPIWPASAMSERIVARLAAHRFPHEVRHLDYDGAGHTLARPGLLPTSIVGMSGGEPRMNAHAQHHAWQQLLQFLGRWSAAGGVSPSPRGSRP